MTNGMDRKLSSVNYAFRKVYRKLSAYKFSHTLAALVVTGLAVFLLGGGVYDVILAENPPYPYPYWIYWISQTGEIVYFYPGRLDMELLGGSVIVMILYALGTLGLLMAYRSMRYVHNPRHGAMLLLIGLIFIILAFVLIESIIYNYKIHYQYG